MDLKIHNNSSEGPTDFVVRVNLFDTISQLKELIQAEHTEILLGNRRLRLDDDILEDDRTISSYGISTESVVQIVSFPDNQPPPPPTDMGASTSTEMAASTPARVEFWQSCLDYASGIPPREVEEGGRDRCDRDSSVLRVVVELDQGGIDCVVEVGLMETFRTIKRQIENILNIPVDRQILSLNGMVYADHCEAYVRLLTLDVYKLRLARKADPPATEKVYINVKVPTLCFEIYSNSSLELKTKMYDQLMEACVAGRLTFNTAAGRQLVLLDGRSLNECGITNHSELELLMPSPVTTASVGQSRPPTTSLAAARITNAEAMRRAAPRQQFITRQAAEAAREARAARKQALWQARERRSGRVPPAATLTLKVRLANDLELNIFNVQMKYDDDVSLLRNLVEQEHNQNGLFPGVSPPYIFFHKGTVMDDYMSLRNHSVAHGDLVLLYSVSANMLSAVSPTNFNVVVTTNDGRSRMTVEVQATDFVFDLKTKVMNKARQDPHFIYPPSSERCYFVHTHYAGRGNKLLDNRTLRSLQVRDADILKIVLGD